MTGVTSSKAAEHRDMAAKDEQSSFEFADDEDEDDEITVAYYARQCTSSPVIAMPFSERGLLAAMPGRTLLVTLGLQLQSWCT